MFPAIRSTRWVTFDCYGTLVNGDVSPVRPLGDVESLLAELRLRGYKIGVLTNCDDAQFESAHRKFLRPFDLFVTAERVRGYKPSPWHFRAFELLTGARKDDWVHVACSWYHDIAPAQARGVNCVWLDRDRTAEPPAGAPVPVHTAAAAADAIDSLFRQPVGSGS